MTASIDSEIDRIDSLLPQTQCTQCGFTGCRPYAEAIVRDAAPINRCPPGGARGIARLAAALGREPLALDPTCGSEGPRMLARIVAADCIGCTKCIQACPVDAIIGVGKRMHTVLPSLCTGCELCVPPCPTDCILIEPASSLPPWSDADAQAARRRFEARRARLVREREDNDRRLAGKVADKLAHARAAVREHAGDDPDSIAARRRQAAIEAAMRRARERLAARGGGPGR
ncbi:MAG: electron transport complex subunit RsxB [Burkholderiaceae bacterium]|nr:electron transport complex subunit RsxB [Burkholderiaceae bacterium]